MLRALDHQSWGPDGEDQWVQKLPPQAYSMLDYFQSVHQTAWCLYDRDWENMGTFPHLCFALRAASRHLTKLKIKGRAREHPLPSPPLLSNHAHYTLDYSQPLPREVFTSPTFVLYPCRSG